MYSNYLLDPMVIEDFISKVKDKHFPYWIESITLVRLDKEMFKLLTTKYYKVVTNNSNEIKEYEVLLYNLLINNIFSGLLTLGFDDKDELIRYIKDNFELDINNMSLNTTVSINDVKIDNLITLIIDKIKDKINRYPIYSVPDGLTDLNNLNYMPEFNKKSFLYSYSNNIIRVLNLGLKDEYYY